MTMEMGKIIGQSLGSLVKVDQNRNGGCLGDFLRIKVEIDVFQPLRRILKVRLPSGDRVVVDLLYEWLPAYCFLCGCFDHTGLGCHLYTGGNIDASTAPSRSWLRTEVKRETRRALLGHRFGLGEEDASMEFEDDHRPSDLEALVDSPVVSDSLPVGTDLGVSENLRDDLGQGPFARGRPATS